MSEQAVSLVTRPATYPAASKWLHWIVGLIVIVMIPVGLVMGDLPEGPTQDRIFALHESFGILVLVLMVARLVNRSRGAPAPDPRLSSTERKLSVSVHHLFYLLLFLMPIIGWVALSAYGARVNFFGLGELPALMAKNEPLSDRLFWLHWAGGLLLAALILLHVGGALRHALRKDGVVSRMLPKGWAGSA